MKGLCEGIAFVAGGLAGFALLAVVLAAASWATVSVYLSLQ